jgi:gamma-glutamyltranspeptidase
VLTPFEFKSSTCLSSATSPYPETSGRIELESGRLIAQLASALKALGHKDVKIVPLISGAVFIKFTEGRWQGESDPRRDGTVRSAQTMQNSAK